jgi:transcriptional regulator with XRE-family HTH domain
MKQHPYRERDYAFGQVMLTLRTAIGLTQAELADFLGISRRAVGEWEAGNSYPKGEHLKRFIALALKKQAFPVGHEAEQVRSLWQAAHQKVLLDEQWLAALLNPTPLPDQVVHAPVASTSGPRVRWGDAPVHPAFYGREWELGLLAEWVVQAHCRVVSVLGLGGIGKSALAVNLMHRVAGNFQVVVWRSLRDVPSCDALLSELLLAVGEVPANPDQRMNVLLEYLRSTRVLLVLDNLETFLGQGQDSGRMRPGYEGFGRFLHLVAETEHRSCVLLTSREKPSDLLPQEGSHAPVRALRVARLDASSCERLLVEKGVAGSAPERMRLIETYAGNPQALKIVAQTIVDLFEGEIAPFLAQGEVIFGGVRELLAQQFTRLSALEQCVLLWLAVVREPFTLDELLGLMLVPQPRARVLEAIEALRRRSFIEPGQTQGSFRLQLVVLEYVTSQFGVGMTTSIIPAPQDGNAYYSALAETHHEALR